MVSGKARYFIAAAIFPVIALCGCAASDDADIRSTAPMLSEFDVPRPLLKVYASEIDMLITCKVGPVSTIYDLAIDPRFDRDKNTASIALIGTGYFSSRTWGMIDMGMRGSVTHVRVFGERRTELGNLGRNVEMWANAGTGC
jgi:hypothetical protein